MQCFSSIDQKYLVKKASVITSPSNTQEIISSADLILKNGFKTTKKPKHKPQEIYLLQQRRSWPSQWNPGGLHEAKNGIYLQRYHTGLEGTFSVIELRPSCPMLIYHISPFLNRSGFALELVRAFSLSLIPLRGCARSILI